MILALLALSFNFKHARSDWIKRGQSIYEENDSEKSAHRTVAISKNGQTVAYAVPYAEEYRGAVTIRKLDNNYFHQKGQTILGVKAGDHSGSAIAISASGDIVAIGSRYWDGSVHNVGHVRVFAYNGTRWNQFGDIILGDAAHDYAGHSLDMSSDGLTVAIGAIGNDNGASSSGMVGVFAYNGTNWNQKGQSIYGETAGDRSGHSVSIAGDTVAIGSDGSNVVRVYEYNDDNKIWTKQGHDIEGKEVSLSEDALTLAVGSPLDDTVGHNAGFVTVYTSKYDRTWQQMGQPIYGLLAGDRLGSSISVSGNGLRVAMGSHLHKEGETGVGYLRIVQWDGKEWIPRGRTIYGAPNHGLGFSVSLSHRGDWVAVGAAGLPQVWPGYARVYEYPIVGVISVKLASDFESTCGDEVKSGFLAKCSEAISPAQCYHCYSGSTIVEIVGDPDVVHNLGNQIITDNGITVDGTTHTLLEMVDTSPERIESIGAALGGEGTPVTLNSYAPSATPTLAPTVEPSALPSFAPSIPLTSSPSRSPSRLLSSSPSTAPTGSPSVSAPSLSPTLLPSSSIQSTAPTVLESISITADVDGANEANKGEACDSFAKSLAGKRTRCDLIFSGRRQLQTSQLDMDLLVPDSSLALSQIDNSAFISSLVVPEGVVVHSVTSHNPTSDDFEEDSKAGGLTHVVLLITFILLMLLC